MLGWGFESVFGLNLEGRVLYQVLNLDFELGRMSGTNGEVGSHLESLVSICDRIRVSGSYLSSNAGSWVESQG